MREANERGVLRWKVQVVVQKKEAPQKLRAPNAYNNFSRKFFISEGKC